MSNLLKDHVKKDKLILDFGCGTGLLGEQIKKKLKHEKTNEYMLNINLKIKE